MQHIFREKKTELVFWFSHDFMNLAKPMNLSESVALSVKWYEDLHLHIKEVLNTKTFEMYKNVLSTWYIFLFISCFSKDMLFHDCDFTEENRNRDDMPTLQGPLSFIVNMVMQRHNQNLSSRSLQSS